MKKGLFLLMFCLSLGLSAQDAAVGMQFSEKSFDELLAQAKEEDKLIFIDAYTTWCGPCKMMARKVFPAERVGNFYNDRFINAKFDMEKGEGLTLARKYRVRAYPTYLFVNGEGELMHKALGYIPQDEFIAIGEVADSDQNLGTLTARYDGGDRNPDFLSSYASTLIDVYEEGKANLVINSYLDSQDDWSDPGVLKLLINSPGQPGGKRMNFLVENADAAIDAAGGDSYMSAVQMSMVKHHMRNARSRILPKAEDMSVHYTKYAGPIKDRLKSHYDVFYAERTGNMDAYVSAAYTYYTKYGSKNYLELDALAWNFFENTDNPKYLLQALDWAKESVAINANYANLDTLAWLYKKTGNEEKAREIAEMAIEMAKDMGVDYSDTEKILND
jgi:thioredoxin-related protein